MDYKISDNDFNEGIDLLKKLVSFPTVLDEYKENSDAPFGKSNKECLNYLLNKALSDGFKVKNIDNYCGYIEFGEGEELIGILAHLDVVPVKVSEWDSNPFELSIRDGKMYARGSIDDKGPLACSYQAMKNLKDSGFKPNKRVRLICGCDEESGSRCMERYLEKEEMPTMGFSPDASFPLIYGEKGMSVIDIVGECDDVISQMICGDRYNIVPSICKAKLNCDLSKEFFDFLNEFKYKGEIKDGYYITYGKASHAMCPQEGINAAYIMFEFLNKYTNSKLASFVNEYFLNDTWGKKLGIDFYDADMKELTSNFAIAMVEGNNFKLGINLRVPVDSLFTVIDEKLKNACNKYGYKFNASHSKRHFVSLDNPLIKTLMASYQRVTGDYENKPITIGGGTYAREFKNSVAFGPVFVGREDVCHIANEYMYASDFRKAMEVYLDAIYELSK